MNDKPLVQELGDESVSAYRRYLDIFVGRSSLGALLKYELLAGVLPRLPGALGYVARRRCYRSLLAGVGPGSLFGAGMVLRCPGRITLGRGVIVDDDVVLDAKGEESSIVLGDNVLLGRGSILSCNRSTISIGGFVSVGPYCFLVSRSRLSIGSNVAIGAGVYMLGGGHARDDVDTPVILQARTSQGITVEDGAWIGIGAKILDGVVIGQHSIVGAGAVVSKDVPPWSVVLGNPARIVEKRKPVATE